MSVPGGETASDLSRRSLLAAAGGSLALTAGCVSRARSLINRDRAEQIELTVKTVPADVDPAATAIAHRLIENLQVVGIDAHLEPMDESELLRDVLVNRDFELYVLDRSFTGDPDVLRPLFHSRFDEEPGWQNPFGFTNLQLDELLEEQVEQARERRRTTIDDIQTSLAREQPVIPVATADRIRVVHTDRIEEGEIELGSPLGYLTLSPADEVEDGIEEVRVAVTDDRMTQNLNPLAIEFRTDGTYTGLLYDPLARHVDGELRPWLAESWEWSRENEGLTATITLREGVEWHDGSQVAATDVAFSYRFYDNTALGETETQVPAPQFRGRSSLVESTEVVDLRTVELTLGDVHESVARRVLTVPVLPQHVWEERAEEVEVGGVTLQAGTTEALVWENPEPVGSGPLRLVERQSLQRLVFERVENHFSADIIGEPAYERLIVQVVPSAETAVSLLSNGEADLTGTPLPPSVVPEAARNDGIQLAVNETETLYHVGCNVQVPPLHNPHFRRVVARLLDKEALVETTFRGYADPATSILSGTEWFASGLEWNGQDPEVPFLGDEDEIDEAAAREAFREIGYEYGSDGELLTR